MSFKPVSSQENFPELEKQLLRHWYSDGIVDKYLHKNDASSTQFSFLDGPITANNPMGVHHAWGRTYKDLWQRYHTMKGDRQRYQNGFDCQGLWVEVEVEKELGFKNKKDIETFGVADFVDKCKERVLKYAAIQTDQSKRLGYFMDWENSYYTMSDKNNYTIWHFLQVCWQRGWIYKGHDAVPWCPRCETAISQHEMLTEDYKEITHKSVFIQFPITGRDNEYLLVWTTTPWTIPANIAVAVDADLDYALVKDGDNFYWLAKGAVDRVFGKTAQVTQVEKGSQLVGLKYSGAFDRLEKVAQVASDYPDKFHIVLATDSQILPITADEGTGLVHTAVSAGEEDFKLGQKHGLPMISVIADNADYLPGLGELSGQNAKKHPEIVLDYLLQNGFAWKIENYTHRYPACWRCKSELVWKVADEWYIAMDRVDPTHSHKLTLRQEMLEAAKKITWIPAFGLGRELDWLKNMHDWLISKKNRYWGLALPIYECPKCGNFEIIGSREELESRAVSGWNKFSGHTPHKPWIDEVKIKCSKCEETISRIPDVGNPWLDAGIVSFSTLPQGWFPADFITESFPGQFKNWFYSLIAMSTVLTKENPFKTVLGFYSLLAEDGRPMHKSWGNSIEFNEGADKIGVDVIRWMYVTQNPENNLLFGYKAADDTRRRFHLMLWNIYNFFVTYANVDKFSLNSTPINSSPTVLDKWILARLHYTLSLVTRSLDSYDAYTASHCLEEFVNDLSLWYVRRSRDRVGPSAVSVSDKQVCYSTLYQVLVTLSRILAPFLPFMSDSIYANLTGQESVHLSTWPEVGELGKYDTQIIDDMKKVREIVEKGLSIRKSQMIKVRQPLAAIAIYSPIRIDNPEICQLIKDELNVKSVIWKKADELRVELDTRLTDELIAEGKNRELIRSVQEQRKQLGAKLDQYIRLTAPLPANPHLVEELQQQTLAKEVYTGKEIKVELL
jgi:isoleucyl-tRNA synthetase